MKNHSSVSGGLVQWLSAGSLRWWGLGLGSASDGGRFGKRNVVGFGCGPITSRYGEMGRKKMDSN